MRFLLWTVPFWLPGLLGMAEEEVKKPVFLHIENLDGAVLEAEVMSIVRTEEKRSWLFFRAVEKERFFLYPFSSLSVDTLGTLSNIYETNGLLVADGVTSAQLEILEKYISADPRERLLLKLREARKKERFLNREWERLQKQTWQLQQDLARTTDPVVRKNVASAFQNSLRARDRVGKQLSLCRVEIRRMEENLSLLRRMGVDIEEDLFGEITD